MFHNTYMSKTYINDNINHKITHSFAGRDREQSFSTAMTQQGIEMEKNKLHKKKSITAETNEVQGFEIMVPNTEKGRSFQQELYAKLFHHWQNDLTNKVGFDVQKSGFAIENLPTCSSSPDYTLRCVFIMKNIRTDKVNMLSILANKFQLESFFYTHNVKMCSDIKWMHPNEKKKFTTRTDLVKMVLIVLHHHLQTVSD